MQRRRQPRESATPAWRARISVTLWLRFSCCLACPATAFSSDHKTQTPWQTNTLTQTIIVTRKHQTYTLINKDTATQPVRRQTTWSTRTLPLDQWGCYHLTSEETNTLINKDPASQPVRQLPLDQWGDKHLDQQGHCHLTSEAAAIQPVRLLPLDQWGDKHWSTKTLPVDQWGNKGPHQWGHCQLTSVETNALISEATSSWPVRKQTPSSVRRQMLSPVRPLPVEQCMHTCKHVYVCACVCQRERERMCDECVCVCVCKYVEDCFHWVLVLCF